MCMYDVWIYRETDIYTTGSKVSYLCQWSALGYWMKGAEQSVLDYWMVGYSVLGHWMAGILPSVLDQWIHLALYIT